MKRYVGSFALLIVLGLVVLPSLAYAVGQLIIGPYEGSGGLAGFLSTIFASLAEGSAAAIVLVASPLIIATVWWLVLAWMRRSVGPVVEAD